MNKIFMDFFSDDFFKEKQFSESDFVESLGNLNDISSFEILDKISVLKNNNRKQMLKNDLIRNKLRQGLLYESMDNPWYYYREIFKKISLSDLLSIYDSEFILNYFKNKDAERCRFYSACCEENVNVFVRYILNSAEIYEDVLNNSGFLSSYVENLSYDLLKEIVLKMQNEHFKFNLNFFCDVSEDFQKRIINEDFITDDTLIILIPVLDNKIINWFFENDLRALYLYNRFNISSFVMQEIKFNDNIVKKKDFFDSLKKESFVEFRNIINKIEKVNNASIIEDRLNEYYNEIINNYDVTSGLFRYYDVILNNPGKYKMISSYIFNFDVVCKISENLCQDKDGVSYYKNREELSSFLKSETSKKLSEVIIDALFGDNIYNVWLNIREMLRYNSIMSSDDKVLDLDRENFYNIILNFDKVSNDVKIDIYNKYKNKDLNLLFYSDLRKIKDVSYEKIKGKLINPLLCPEYIDNCLSDKYGVQVYDFSDKEYVMLVRNSAEFRGITCYRRSCYSIISNENNQTFGEYDTSNFLYGYVTFDNDMILHMFERDSYSTNFKESSSRYVNRIMTAEQLVKANSSYSEVQILNDKNDENKYRWNAKKPDFIIVFNVVCERHIKESKRLGIPIVIIKKKILDKDKVIDVGFDEGIDTYVRTIFDEDEHRIRR